MVALSRSDNALGKETPMVLNKVAFRKKAVMPIGSAAEYRSKPLCTLGACAKPAGRKKPMMIPTTVAMPRPNQLKPITSTLG